MTSSIAPLLSVQVDTHHQSAQGFGVSKFAGYFYKYGGKVYVTQGDCYMIDETAQREDSEPSSAISVLEMLYVHYLSSMTLERMCNVQVYPLFVTAQLGLSQSYIGFIKLFNDMFGLLLNSTGYNDWTAKKLDWWDRQWVSCLGCAVINMIIALSPSGNLGALCIAAGCVVSSFIPGGPFSTFRRRWCDRTDDSVGASLQVGCRYLGVALGVKIGITVATLTILSFRGVFVFAALVYLLLGGWSYWASRATNPREQEQKPREQQQTRETQPEDPHTTKWSALSANMNAAITVVIFSVFTDIARATWPRTLTYVANNSSFISPEQSADVNSSCHLISLCGIILTPWLVDGGKLLCCDVGKNGLRIAAILSFFSLAFAHYLISQASSHSWFVASGIAFGLGEALSCGLREDVRMTARRAMEDKGRSDAYIKMFDNGVGLIENIVNMVVGFAIPVLGDPSFFGMQKVSLVLCSFAAVATLYSACLGETPDTNKKGNPPKTRHPGSMKVVHCPCF